jgi:plasmid stability protein
MPILQVRDLPADLYHTLSSLAKYEHRSLAQETIVVLRKGLEITTSYKERRQAALQRIKAMHIKLPPDAPEPVDLIRADRDR